MQHLGINDTKITGSKMEMVIIQRSWVSRDARAEILAGSI